MRRILFIHLFAWTAGLAVAVLIASCRATNDDKASSMSSGDASGAEAAFQHTRNILSFGPRPPGSAALKKTRDYIAGELARFGWQVRSQRAEYDDVPLAGSMTFTNLIARYGPPDEPSVWQNPVKGLLGAHIDSKYYVDRRFLGADDAASAVGVILELARQLGDVPDLARQVELVFFDGEEAFGQNITLRDGLYGSRAYAKRWRVAEERPDFGIVLDMIGHKNLRISYPSDTPSHLEEALIDAAEAEGEASRYTKAPNPIQDDHVPLNDAGIPAIDVIGDFTKFAWWHTPADNLRIISRESLDITLRVTFRMLKSLLDENDAKNADAEQASP